MGKTVILGFARTPFGRFLGSLREMPAVELYRPARVRYRRVRRLSKPGCHRRGPRKQLTRFVLQACGQLIWAI